jgi:hypothetical protein
MNIFICRISQSIFNGVSTIALLVAALFVGTVSCSKPVAPDTTAERLAAQKIVFEVEFFNYTQIYNYPDSHFGIYVDNAGGVYSYDRKGVQWGRDGKTALTEQVLLGKYINTKRIGTIDQATLINTFALSQRIVSELEMPIVRSADAGTWTFWAYTLNPVSTEGVAAYEQTMLYRAGDVMQVNSAKAAQELTAWLRTLDDRLQSLPCEN